MALSDDKDEVTQPARERWEAGSRSGEDSITTLAESNKKAALPRGIREPRA